MWRAPSRAGRTEKIIRVLARSCRPHCLEKSRASSAPVHLLGRGGSPVFRSFAFPQCEGWRAEHACHGFRRGGPGVTGRPRARGLVHPCADGPALSQRATRHRSAFAFTAAGPAGAFTPAAGFYPAAARRTWLGANLREATHAGTASRPTLITPHEAPSQWTERSEYRNVLPACQAQFTQDDVFHRA